jgi:hypothetical protein
METPNTPITVTMTEPRFRSGDGDFKTQHDAHYNSEVVTAVREFRNSNSAYAKVPAKFYTQLDMAQAHVALTRDFITNTENTYNDTETTYTFTLRRMWAVFAPRLADGVLFTVAGNNKWYFETEAEATKFMKKTAKAAAEWHFQESLRNKYAAQAQAVCALDGKTATPAGLIDDSECIGQSVRIHQMGKFRTGIIVGQTPTKYVVVYTTPSNPTEIRTTKIGKDGSK